MQRRPGAAARHSAAPGARSAASATGRGRPPSALHPTIGVHSPLVFDLVDTWNGRSLGGFTYHVVHPGGRSYDDHPVNAMAAEARRAARFEALGHTAGAASTSARWPPTRRRGVPATLDLRRFLPGDR